MNLNGSSPPLFAELADLVHHHTLLGRVERGGRHPELRAASSNGRHLQDAIGEGEHHTQVHQSVRVLALQREDGNQGGLKDACPSNFIFFACVHKLCLAGMH